MSKGLSYPSTYYCSYKKLQGLFTTHAYDFEFWYFGHISVVVHTHESRYSAHDRAPQPESCPLLEHHFLSLLSQVIKGSLIFPLLFLLQQLHQPKRIIRPSLDFYNGKGGYNRLVYHWIRLGELGLKFTCVVT